MNTKNLGGRPKKTITEQDLNKVEALGAVLSIEQIADYFEMSKTTFYAIMERQPEVFERYKKGKAKAIGNVAQNLIKQAQEGNTSAMIFYLKTQAGWKETQAVETKISLVDEVASLMEEISNEVN